MNMRPADNGTCQFVVADGKEYMRLSSEKTALLFPNQPYIWYVATDSGWQFVNDDREHEATFQEIK